jgi:hypothetical protein
MRECFCEGVLENVMRRCSISDGQGERSTEPDVSRSVHPLDLCDGYTHLVGERPGSRRFFIARPLEMRGG